ncbi:MAG: phosphoserine phosphatase [Candidatus Endobugula sp.]|jgi:phosphoserine phosphatase
MLVHRLFVPIAVFRLKKPNKNRINERLKAAVKNIILISLSGVDKPGITSSVSQIMAEYKVNVLDIGQAVIHNQLNLGLLVELDVADKKAQFLADITTCAESMGISPSFDDVSVDSYNDWVENQGKSRHIVTLLTKIITAEHIAAITAVGKEYALNFDNITRLSGRIPLDSFDQQSKASVEFSARGEVVDLAGLRKALMQLASSLDIDIAVQEDNLYRRNRRLVCFDMDSTLIDAEVIDELAKEAGVGDQVIAITEAAMSGEIDFNESFKQRMALLKGLDESVLEKVASRLKLTEGAEKLVYYLHKLGYKTAILSGGFDYFGRYLQAKLNIDYVYANQLDIVAGKVTGKVVGTVVNGERKAELLRELAQKEGLSLEQVIAVGDGANDLPMLSIAGLGIAFRAKPLVKESAKQSISHLGLDAILYLIGFRDRDALKELPSEIKRFQG